MEKIKRITPKEKVLEVAKIDCRKCTHCCEYGSGIVLKSEVKELANKLKIKEHELIERYLEPFEKFNTSHYQFKTKGEPYGRCIFLKQNGCKIHDIKPLHCRIGNCGKYGEELSIWFTINHFVNIYDPESIRQWAAYLKLGNKTIDGCELSELVPDEKRLKKILNYEILQ